MKNKACERWYYKHHAYSLKKRADYRKMVKDKVLNFYGVESGCVCCGEKTRAFLTLDHINNDGYKHRQTTKGGNGIYLWIIKNKFPSIFRIMCWNCNCGRRINKGVCPHKEKLI